ncbi:lipase 3-like [Bacillus rossius redtenbacheri]|uniref:lipase 3-like n=1 Tax=Bacillus rossius redtenbacheri TaxID=93214 RepID=UPI002FDD4408
MRPGAARTLRVLAVAALHAAIAGADFRTTHELIKQHGYPVEMHQVVTEDGYVLNMHRIPHSGRQPAHVDDEEELLQYLDGGGLRDERGEQREAKRSADEDEDDDDKEAPMRRLSIHEYVDPCRGESQHRSPMEQQLWAPTDKETSRTADRNSRTADGSSRTADGSSRKADGRSRTADGSSRTADVSSRTADVSSRTADGSSQKDYGNSVSAEGKTRTTYVNYEFPKRNSRTANGNSAFADENSRTARVKVKTTTAGTAGKDGRRIRSKEGKWMINEGSIRTVERSVSVNGSSVGADEASVGIEEGNIGLAEARSQLKDEETPMGQEDQKIDEAQRAWFSAQKTSTRRPVVLLQHGVLASSLDWVLTGPGKALGYKLSDAGWDVWLGNFRGTFYSRQHLNLTTDDADYWDYSWDELGRFDLAAMVDHVLRATGREQLHFVGHSMGATVAVVLLSERPEYNAKIKATVLLAPVVRLRHNTSVFRHYAAIWSALQKMSIYSGMRGFPPDPPMLHRRLAPVCRERYIGQGICANILHTVAGYAANINNTLLPMLFGHYPSQTSVRTLSHFLQGMYTGNFSKFDFGGNNMERYRRDHPPDYDVGRITSATSIFYGDSDPFTSIEDMAWLEGSLPNVVSSRLVPSRSFSHLSFLWAADVDQMLYEPLLKLLKLR